MTIFQRISTFALAMNLLLVVAFAPTVHTSKVQAQLPVTDAANLVANTATAANTTAQSGGFAPKNILDGLAWSVAKMTIQSLTRSTVNWINSGFNGSPAFISDLNQNLSALGDAVADDFFNHLNEELIRQTGFNLTSPFQDQLNQQLRLEFYKTTGSWGINNFYTLYKDTPDPKAFLSGDFSQGGFNAFMSASQNPGNNPFGAYKLANDQLFAQIDANVQRRKSELDWGRGFLPWRGNCPAINAANPTLSRQETCLFNSVKTPGSIIESSLGITATSPLKQLELADSINEIVAALMGQMINQVLGPGGLAGVSQPTAGGGASFLDLATDPAQYQALNASLSGGVVQSITDDIIKITAYRESWQKILTASTNAQNYCGLRPDISSVIVTATANVARGDVALSKAASTQQVIGAAASTTVQTGTTQISEAVAAYQSFLTFAPSPTEYAQAQLESADTGAAPGITPSTYTRMVILQQTCTPLAI